MGAGAPGAIGRSRRRTGSPASLRVMAAGVRTGQQDHPGDQHCAADQPPAATTSFSTSMPKSVPTIIDISRIGATMLSGPGSSRPARGYSPGATSRRWPWPAPVPAHDASDRRGLRRNSGSNSTRRRTLVIQSSTTGVMPRAWPRGVGDRIAGDQPAGGRPSGCRHGLRGGGRRRTRLWRSAGCPRPPAAARRCRSRGSSRMKDQEGRWWTASARCRT